ncbi:enterobactin synthase subunit E [Klebsiella aerogenes]|nr:enterobactin synthase subunit E [Klebsiella aerogenes]
MAIIDGERQISYRQFNQLVDNLACSLQRQGLKRGETALVQLGNVAEFYITFFALLRIGVAPVNALFSHQRSELNAYAAQIKPALLIADREHALFADDSFLMRLSLSILPCASHCCVTTAASAIWRRRLTARRITLSPIQPLPTKWPFPALRRQHRDAEADPAHP